MREANIRISGFYCTDVIVQFCDVPFSEVALACRTASWRGSLSSSESLSRCLLTPGSPRSQQRSISAKNTSDHYSVFRSRQECCKSKVSAWKGDKGIAMMPGKPSSQSRINTNILALNLKLFILHSSCPIHICIYMSIICM